MKTHDQLFFCSSGKGQEWIFGGNVTSNMLRGREERQKVLTVNSGSQRRDNCNGCCRGRSRHYEETNTQGQDRVKGRHTLSEKLPFFLQCTRKACIEVDKRN